MANIFPFVDVTPETEQATVSELPLFREYGWDAMSGDFTMKDGNPVMLEGQEALKGWIYKALVTERFRYLAYTWSYGSELERLIGSAFSARAKQSEAERYVREALLVNPYIVDIKDMEVSFAGDTLQVQFTATTVYGEVNIVV